MGSIIKTMLQTCKQANRMAYHDKQLYYITHYKIMKIMIPTVDTIACV